MFSRTTLAAFMAAGAATLALAQTNITADVCADPSTFTSCTTKADADAKGCMDVCNGNKLCVLSCGCAMYQAYMNCVGESCWNQAYSCEYGKLVATYFAECPVASEPVPFWPAPDNAPGGCSCNLGKVLQATLNAQKENNACLTNKTTTNVIELSNKYTACGCCEVSAGLSAMYETCPDTIPADMGADLWLQVSTIYGSVVHWGSCGSVMDAYDCGKLGFAPPSSNSSTFYKPNNLPPNGTQTLHNTGAANALTAPPSGSVFTWSQSSVTYTVTASPWKNNQVKATGTGNAGTTEATGTAATGSANSGAKSGATASRQLSLGNPAVWLPAIAAVAILVLGQ
ncbi:hypothetical protein CNMCM5623_009641 [Aspergillus felis]|uniref:GPI anchored protein n=1 Tax=Aspergillus felis TaxID=1287682 RepID=A0A8H6PKK5_9EURO|nr:hypothetical protein CNMCM5623_009641 [Aspergillus felis]